MTCYIKKIGKGFPLVLLHGFGFNHTIWRQGFVEKMSQTHTCYLIDLPGFGQSHFYSDTIIGLIQKLLVQLPEKFILCGWSLGGLIGLQLSLLYPERVSKLITIATDPGFESDKIGIDHQALKLFQIALLEDKDKALKAFLLLQFAKDKFDKKVYQSLLNTIKPLPSLDALTWALTLLTDTKLLFSLSSLNVPSYFIYGEKDRIVSSATHEKMRLYHHPLVQSDSIKGAGHIPFMTHLDEVTQKIRAYI